MVCKRIHGVRSCLQNDHIACARQNTPVDGIGKRVAMAAGKIMQTRTGNTFETLSSSRVHRTHHTQT